MHSGKSNYTLGEFRRQMKAFIEDMIDDPKKFEQFEDEIMDVRQNLLVD